MSAIWPSWRTESGTIRNHPKFKIALQSYNSIQYIEMHLRKGSRFRDTKPCEVILHVLCLFRCARDALEDLQILDRREFDKFSRVHVQYISTLLSGCQ